MWYQWVWRGHYLQPHPISPSKHFVQLSLGWKIFGRLKGPHGSDPFSPRFHWSWKGSLQLTIWYNCRHWNPIFVITRLAIWTFRICISVMYGAFLTSSSSIITSFSDKYTHSIPFTSFCALLVKYGGVCINIFPPSLLYRRRF